MNEENNKVLDLDELFGQAKAVKVRWQGEEYEFLRMEGISPKQTMQFDQLRKKVAKLQKAKLKSEDGVSEAQASQIDDILNQMVKLLCPAFPVDDVGFMLKTQIIQFYMEQTRGKKVTKAMLKQQTGETSSLS